MPITTVRDTLLASSECRTLVGDRIAPVETEQGAEFPCVVLTIIGVEPQNSLSGYANLDRNTVQLDAWDFKYAKALEIANACRTALEAAGHVCINRITDQFGLEKNPGAYRVSYEFQVWTS